MLLPVPEHAERNVEMICSRLACHVWYYVPPEAVDLLEGEGCPTCHAGVLKRKEAVTDRREQR